VEGPHPEVRDPWGNVKTGASATTKVNRRDFGLVWNVSLETGGVLVGDDVTITLELEMARQ
jgi:polyisoprenoid-binding protein YceI